MHVTCWLVPDARRGASSTPSPAMTSPAWAFRVTWIPRARTRKSWPGSWPQRHGCTQDVLKWPGLAVAQDCSPVENHLQAAAGQVTVGRSKCSEAGRPLELELSLLPSVLVAKACAMRVPSQTAGLVSTSLKFRDSTPLHEIKLFMCGPVPHLKPLAHPKR